jgi:RND family efflux transporter MFP subunit
VVTERFTDPGNLAAPGAPLVRIDADGPRHVEVQVDEARAGYVRPGDAVAVLLEAADGDAITGTVTEVARAIAAGQRAFTVKVALPADATPRTGTFARVRFRGEARSAIVVPSAAVRRQGQVTSVFVVQDGIARIRLVRAGVTDQGRVEVLAGLEAGEMVVAPPPPALVDGQPVKVASTGVAAGARP